MNLMKHKTRNGTLLAAIFAVTGFTLSAFAQTNLDDMHHAFANGDFKQMTTKMKAALEESPEDPQVQKNVFDLLAKAYQIQGPEGVSVDWHLPSEITNFKVAVRRVLKGEIRYKLKLRGSTTGPNMIKQIQVIHNGDVILDRLAGIGEWEDEVSKDDIGFSLQTKGSSHSIETGLYLLNIELNDGKKTPGWFLVDDTMNAATAPQVASPEEEQVFYGGYPSFKWTNYFSSSYLPSETRSLWIGVSRNEPPNYDWDQKWEMWKANPSVEQATVGEKLDSGNYVVYFNYTELKRFGDIQVGLASVTGRSFQVKP